MPAKYEIYDKIKSSKQNPVEIQMSLFMKEDCIFLTTVHWSHTTKVRLETNKRYFSKFSAKYIGVVQFSHIRYNHAISKSFQMFCSILPC